MCSGSEVGSYVRLIDFVYHSTLGLRVIQKKKKGQELATSTTVFGVSVYRGTSLIRNSAQNLRVRIHFIIEMIRWTGLAPWQFEFPLPGSLSSTFLVNPTPCMPGARKVDECDDRRGARR